MDDLNTLELLKSLTLGVNNKINQEQDSEIEYIVSTSLSNKKKKSAPPIIKEVIKEKKSTEVEIIEDEVFYEPDIIEESFDIIEEPEGIINDLGVSEDSFKRFTNIENDAFVDDSEEDFLLETKEIEPDIFIEDEAIIEEVIVDNAIMDNDVIKDNAVDLNDSGHISEELVEKKKKIERNGNPFKRGPRRKKDKVEKKVESFAEPIVEPIIDTTETTEDTLIDEIIATPIETNVIEEVVSEDYLDELHNLDDSEFDSLFSDFDDTFGDETEDISEVVEEEEVSEDLKKSVDLEKSELEVYEVEEVEVQNDFSDNDEKCVSDIDFSEEEELEIEEDNEAREVIPTKVEEVIDTKDDLDFLNSLSKDSIPEVKIENTEEIEENKNEDEDAKFKDCIYHRGMSVEEFLRENPNYRDALYVEHFFSKEELNKLIVSGLLLMKKGKYRL